MFPHVRAAYASRLVAGREAGFLQFAVPSAEEALAVIALQSAGWRIPISADRPCQPICAAPSTVQRYSRAPDISSPESTTLRSDSPCRHHRLDAKLCRVRCRCPRNRRSAASRNRLQGPSSDCPSGPRITSGRALLRTNRNPRPPAVRSYAARRDTSVTVPTLRWRSGSLPA